MFELYKNKIKLIDKEVPEELSRLKGKVSRYESVVLFIFLMYDRSDENPIKDLRKSSRLKMATKIAFNTDDISTIFSRKEIDEILSAAKEYKENSTDMIQRDIDLYDKKIYEFIDLLNQMQPSIIKNTHEITGRVTFSTNIDIIMSILDNSVNIIIDKIALSGMKRTGKYTNELRRKLSNSNLKILNKIKD
jgi:hypothetical protein